MTTTITIAGTTYTPTLVDGYESHRRAQSIVHVVIGSATPDVTLRPALMRTGVLRLVFASEAESKACETAHAGAVTCQLASTDRASIPMTYVVADGDVVRTLDDQTRNVWILQIPFQEIS